MGLVGQSFGRLLAVAPIAKRLPLSGSEDDRDFLMAAALHDLTNALSALKGNLELLVDEVDSLDGRELSKRSQRSLERAVLLGEDLLVAATSERSLALDLVDLGVEAELRLAVEHLPPAAVELAIEPGLVVRADRLRFHQIIGNLVRNAQLHGELPISIRASADGEDMVVIEVSDAGPGVPAELVPHVFDRHTRRYNSSRGGSGLGLAIAHHLAGTQRGTLTYRERTRAFQLILRPW